ncbi:E3 ubiquitin/ISG15 ligase TRIM25-like [Dendropsophus ebraccatus]|uniref:E3 ubiquitin/ISG15 ligase TRIM25-like n=1 Tax=Dendropsophus ebraccatus TaxID=150705 RepID=UPI0038317B24
MASAALRGDLDCSICLITYTDPVMLRCGHNFCRVCIDRLLDTQDGAGVYSCPECRKEYQERPALMRDIALCKLMENILLTPPTPTESGICCTYCVDSAVPAVRSCLHCEASLCDKHLRAHSKSPEHVLSEPSTSLEKRKCSVHKKVLEYYCTEDAACICVSCSLAGEHWGHRVETLKEASEKKKKNLRNVLQKLMAKREEIKERVRSVEERRRKAQEKAAGEAERVTVLFIDIRRQLDDLEKRVLSEISRQDKEESLPLSALIQQLEIKKDELSRKMRHIEELCNMADPLTVLQEPDTARWVNGYTQDFQFQCRSYRSIQSISSVHSNYYEDRMWELSCKNTFDEPASCTWSSFANSLDRSLKFTCPSGSVLSGMYSDHDNRRQDRRWSYLCCRGNINYGSNCEWTDYVNDYDKFFFWSTPTGRFLAGVASINNNEKQDRRWMFYTCEK